MLKISITRVNFPKMQVLSPNFVRQNFLLKKIFDNFPAAKSLGWATAPCHNANDLYFHLIKA